VSDSIAIWLDGRACDALPLPDRGLDFGDGLFETLLLRRGQPLFLDYHLGRLERGLGVLRFPDCLAHVESCIDAAITGLRQEHSPWSAMRVTVSRGSGPRGYAPPEVQQPRVVLSVSPLDRDCLSPLPPARLSISGVRWPDQPLLAGHKHLNRLEQVLAAMEARQAEVDDSVLLGQDGRVISTIAGNIFVLIEGILHTPRLHRCGIEGTRRELLLNRWAPALGIEVRETDLQLDDLSAAREIFFTNSLVGLRPVGRVDAAAWSGHEVCNALFERYREEIG
jgi:4-amino-4-deoxychorismate lyase